MIEVTVSTGRLSVAGHSDYGAKGKDIVCAGVSAITYTLVRSLDSLCADNVRISEGDGIAILEYENLSERAKLLIDSFFIGISGLVEAYPEHVRLRL